METNIQTLFVDSYSGEAYGLRAVYMYYLLRAHGGIGTDGQLLGVPIKTTSESPESDFSQPRDTYAACIEQILSDCDKAIELLPLDYKDGHTESEIPQKYLDLGINVDQYDRVNGVYRAGRISGRIVEAIRAQVTLMAASPAFDESGITWEEAANSAGTVLQRIDGINGIDADGYTWYCNTTEIEGLGNGSNPQEIIWRAGYSDSNTLEGDNFPPSLYGNGRVNPTQNLVDAFPMANGYPLITVTQIMMRMTRMQTETHVWQPTSLLTEAQPEAQRLLPVRMAPTTMQSTGSRDTLPALATTCVNICVSTVI